MIATTYSAAVCGFTAVPVRVQATWQADEATDLVISGVRPPAARTTAARIRAALRASDIALPPGTITVALHPLDPEGDGPHDLAIVAALLQATKIIPTAPEPHCYLGQLALDGTVLPVSQPRARGAGLPLPEARFVGAAPATAQALATLHPRTHGIASVHDLIHGIGHGHVLPDARGGPPVWGKPIAVDFAGIPGNEHVKRALEVAAAGGHHVLLTESPGSLAQQLAQATVGILPPPTLREQRELACLAERSAFLARWSNDGRPFVERHHRAHKHAVYGAARCGLLPAPVLAHGGVLALHDVAAWGAGLDGLGDILHQQEIAWGYRHQHQLFPARCVCIGRQLPCPCGYHGDAERLCTCSPTLVAQYQARVPQALLQHVGIFVAVGPTTYEKLGSQRIGEASGVIQGRVDAARERQRQRWPDEPERTNNLMLPLDVRTHCALDGAGQTLIKAAVRQLGLSAVQYHRVLAVARTIADLAGTEQIGAAHLAEAIQYRPRGYNG